MCDADDESNFLNQISSSTEASFQANNVINSLKFYNLGLWETPHSVKVQDTSTNIP